jgi:predicted Zn-dependent protease
MKKTIPKPSDIESVESTPRPSLELTMRERDWMMLVAYLHLEQHKTDKACALLRLVYRAFPEDAEVQRCLALAELLDGSPVAAARAATRAIKQAEGRLRVPVGLVFAKALWEQGNPEAARDFLATLLITDHR